MNEPNQASIEVTLVPADVIDAIADDGLRNVIGGIYAMCVQEFATQVQRAFAEQNGLQIRDLTP